MPIDNPLNAVITKQFPYIGLFGAVDVGGLYYTCPLGLKWNEGEWPGRLAVCWDNQWSSITDECVIDLSVPRDCSELADRGFNKSDVYLTRPNGVTQPVSWMWCDLDDKQEGAWKTILKADTNSMLPTVSEPFFIGFGFPNVTTFFIGFYHLANLTWGDSSLRPLVLQVLLTTSDGGEYHATYDGVTFGDAPQCTLLSLGSVHGNAGDGLRGAMGQSVGENPTPVWWLPHELTSNLFDMSWLPFAGEKDVSEVVVRVRPQKYDATVACPPLGISPETWRVPPVDMIGHVPNSRAPGVTASITCTEEMFGFDMSDGVRRKTEYLLCEQQSGGPTWNTSFSPCQIICPEGFVPFPEISLCLHQESPVQSPYGAISSVLRCAAAGGATLALAHEINYDQLSNDTGPALTIHRVVDGSIEPPLPANMTCNEDAHHCEIDDFHKCVGVINNETYALVDCGASDYGILCQTPSSCPVGFTNHRGLCYAVESPVSSLMEGQQRCEGGGASLVFPQTREELEFFARLMRQHAVIDGSSGPWKVMLGLNDMSGDFTADGLFLPDDELVGLADITDPTLFNFWRLLEVPTDEGIFPSLLPITFSDTSATYAICMLFGPAGCWTEPPSLAANMTRVWENETKDLSATITYKCDRGYFMDGNSTWPEKNITCTGLLGGWLPGQVLDCIRVEVCNEEIPPAHDLMNSTSDEDIRFLDGTITYTCPPGMMTAEGQINQTITCSENPEGDGYSLQPVQLKPCDVCQGEPSVENATTNWNVTQLWMVNDSVSVTCFPHHILHGEQDGELRCTSSGWEERFCYEGCVDLPPSPGANMTQGEGNYSVGSVLQYTCDPGYFVPPQQMGEIAVSLVEVSCGVDHNWTYVEPLDCYRLCHGDPPLATDNITTTWDCSSRVVGTQINMSCPTNHTFPDLSDTVTITCEEDEEWTQVNSSFLTCRELCPWGNSSQVPDNAIILHDPMLYWLESVYVYGCPDGLESLQGSITVNATCLEDGWIFSEPDFGCYEVCPEDPPSVLPPGSSDWNGYTRILGTQVNLTCPMNYTLGDLNSSFSLTCESDGNWTYVDPDILICRIVCPWGNSSQVPDNAIILHDPMLYWLESVFVYGCPDGLESLQGSTTVNATCLEDGWILSEPDFGCYTDCPEDPPSVPPPGSSNWDGYTRLLGTQVNLTCPMNYTFGDLNSSISLTCKRDRNWTYVDPDILICRIECPEEPPSVLANTTLEDAVPPYWLTSNVTYRCEEGFGFPWGGTVITLTCEEAGWTDLPAKLECLPACSPPPQPKGLVKYNHTGPTLWETVVKYYCPFGFHVEEKGEGDGPVVLYSSCEGGNWSLTAIPKCHCK
ncbi:uncharacterized protein LOC123508315 [Portunus trituberculatus]|uniref:uncharacterized protein LOC123508315 n=1 Tax=Portunus trituberculatus TaxID=210409 RepID=UPI001E1CCDFE|nr:uncharacterized protein LOC123508315 [Portunus trituberculatus]